MPNSKVCENIQDFHHLECNCSPGTWGVRGGGENPVGKPPFIQNVCDNILVNFTSRVVLEHSSLSLMLIRKDGLRLLASYFLSKNGGEIDVLEDSWDIQPLRLMFLLYGPCCVKAQQSLLLH